MLLELHVRSLALIERADVTFGEGLNILTGETGAGKSILIDSVSLALGRKASRDVIRNGAEYAYIELVFSVNDEQKSALKDMDIFPDEDGLLIITRKIMPARSVSRINDETVTSAALKAVTSLLIDIHGQHEHQSLLQTSKHLEILDLYAKKDTAALKGQIAEEYEEYRKLKQELAEGEADVETRRREADLLRYEINEIEDAALRTGEEEALSDLCRRYSHAQRIRESLGAAYDAVETDSVGRALKKVSEAADYDPQVKNIRDQLCDAESVLNDIRHSISSYLDDMTFDEEEMADAEKRLNLIRHLESKYGATEEAVAAALEGKKERLDTLEHYDEYREDLTLRFKHSEEILNDLCSRLTKAREKAAGELSEKISESLKDLNFLDVSFAVEVRPLGHFGANGADEAEFLISTNPGEPPKPLRDVASGGELSRIMLGIKTVLADEDNVSTLIFDEIDTGISGRTAQKVAEKLAVLSRNHQVICITHLPQIASMADCHYEIEKTVNEGKTETRVRPLAQDDIPMELARLLGGAAITDSVVNNAREMKALADEKKADLRTQKIVDF